MIEQNKMKQKETEERSTTQQACTESRLLALKKQVNTQVFPWHQNNPNTGTDWILKEWKFYTRDAATEKALSNAFTHASPYWWDRKKASMVDCKAQTGIWGTGHSPDLKDQFCSLEALFGLVLSVEIQMATEARSVFYQLQLICYCPPYLGTRVCAAG